AQAAQLHTHLRSRPGLDPARLARQLATGRAHLTHRAVIVGTSTDQLGSGLSALADGQPAAHLVQAHTTTSPGRTVFVFPGQAPQGHGMAADLLEHHPVSAEPLHACAQALAAPLDWWLPDVLRQAPQAPRLDRVDVIQPALFAVMVALARLWQHHGVHPD